MSMKNFNNDNKSNKIVENKKIIKKIFLLPVLYPLTLFLSLGVVTGIFILWVSFVGFLELFGLGFNLHAFSSSDAAMVVLIVTVAAGCYILAFYILSSIMKEYEPLDEYFKVKKISIKKTFFIIASSIFCKVFITLFLGFTNFGVIYSGLITMKFLPNPLMKSIFMGNNSMQTAYFEKPNLIVFVALGILIPILHEFIFRGAVYNLLRSFFGIKVSIVIQAFMFGGLYYIVFRNPFIFILGLILGILYICTGSIMSSIIFHVGFYASAFSVYSFLKSSGDYGIILVISFVMFVLTFLLSIRKDDEIRVADGNGVIDLREN